MSKKMMKQLQEAADWLKKAYDHRPQIAVILGSGLGNFTEHVSSVTSISYKDIPHFPVSTVKGHKGKLLFGTIEGKRVVVLAGRFHSYEGYDAETLAFPIRVLKLLGVETLLLSNASGTVNPDHRVGDIVIIKDHISLFVPNPLVGPNLDEFGPRFPDMSEPYDLHLIDKAREIAASQQNPVKEGVYVAVTGPTFETKAEYHMIRAMGADLVGMSTVQENIVARHMGMRVFAASVVTDIGLRTDGLITTHEEVLEAAKAAEPKLARLFTALIASI